MAGIRDNKDDKIDTMIRKSEEKDHGKEDQAATGGISETVLH